MRGDHLGRGTSRESAPPQLTRRLSIRVTRRAADQIEQAAAWWALNRSAAPGAIEEELERVFDLLSVEPGVGSVARNVKLRGVRRVHLSRIRYHLYYRVAAGSVEVVALWHTSRASVPKV